jgi:hypothetical protein
MKLRYVLAGSLTIFTFIVVLLASIQPQLPERTSVVRNSNSQTIHPETSPEAAYANLVRLIAGDWSQSNTSDPTDTWTVEFNADGTYVQKHGSKVVVNNRGREGASTTGHWRIVPDISQETVYDTGTFTHVRPPALREPILIEDDFTSTDYFSLAIEEDGNELMLTPMYLKNGIWTVSSAYGAYKRLFGAFDSQ